MTPTRASGRPDRPDSRTALVTGVTGQDGSLLSELLRSRGARVVGLARSEPAPSHDDASSDFFRGDVADAAFVARVVAETAPSEIYHLASQSSVGASFVDPTGTLRSVALGTLNVLEAARSAASKPRVLLASSAEVFGDLGSERAHEGTPFRPVSPYGVAKAAATDLARVYRNAYGMFVSVAFFYNHESPRRPESFVTRKIVRRACLIARGHERRLELGDTSVVRDWGWASEYVDAAVRILSHDEPDDFVIATGESQPLGAFIEYVFSSLGLDARDHLVTDPALFRPSDIPKMHADPRRAAERLGWRANVRCREVARRLVEAELGALDAASA
jgi:GDPmannose 4,6-dehydratase